MDKTLRRTLRIDCIVNGWVTFVPRQKQCERFYVDCNLRNQIYWDSVQNIKMNNLSLDYGPPALSNFFSDLVKNTCKWRPAFKFVTAVNSLEKNMKKQTAYIS